MHHLFTIFIFPLPINVFLVAPLLTRPRIFGVSSQTPRKKKNKELLKKTNLASFSEKEATHQTINEATRTEVATHPPAHCTTLDRCKALQPTAHDKRHALTYTQALNPRSIPIILLLIHVCAAPTNPQPHTHQECVLSLLPDPQSPPHSHHCGAHPIGYD
jgi:hypothetical protein